MLIEAIKIRFTSTHLLSNSLSLIISPNSNTPPCTLSDGLDGLATGLSMMAIAPFVIFALMQKTTAVSSFAMAVIGALLGFMFYNYHPAKIFMGDVGSLSLGGLLAALAVVTKQELLLVIVGGVFVIEALSVILQVASYKTTGKRIFKMAPIHHHFEMSGWKEKKIVVVFSLVNIIGCAVGIALVKFG